MDIFIIFFLIFFLFILFLNNILYFNLFFFIKILINMFFSFFIFFLFKKTLLGNKLIIFFKESKLEISRIYWPDFKVSIKTTIVVFFLSIFISLLILFIDDIIFRIISNITNLNLRL